MTANWGWGGWRGVSQWRKAEGESSLCVKSLGNLPGNRIFFCPSVHRLWTHGLSSSWLPLLEVAPNLPKNPHESRAWCAGINRALHIHPEGQTPDRGTSSAASLSYARCQGRVWEIHLLSGQSAGNHELYNPIVMSSSSGVQVLALPLNTVPPFHYLLSMGFSRQGYYSGLPWPLPGDLPYPGI